MRIIIGYENVISVDISLRLKAWNSFLEAARFTAKRIVSKGFPPFLIVVSNTDRNIANISEPRSDRKLPDTFCLTFIFRIACSEPLLSYGTSG
jgi:hypothetical protein